MLGEGQKNPLREVPPSDFCSDTLAVLQLQEDLGSVVCREVYCFPEENGIWATTVIMEAVSSLPAPCC